VSIVLINKSLVYGAFIIKIILIEEILRSIKFKPVIEMGKYLTNFKTKEEYDTFKSSSDYVVPNVSFVEDSGSIINDSYQISGSSNNSTNYEYIDISELSNDDKLSIIGFAAAVKLVMQEANLVGIFPTALLLGPGSTDASQLLNIATSVAIDMDLEM
jgi:hypothetical protein